MSAQPPAQRRLGRYELEDLIGRGAFGEVWRAVDTSLGRKVAIKNISAQAARRGQGDLLLNEARAVAGLNHPSIVPIFDIGRDDANYFIVTELVNGPNLAEFIARDRLSLADKVRIGLEIAQALAFAHTQGVLHGDIKPSNILVDRNTGHASLTDFGLAKRIEEIPILGAAEIRSGTPAYMAPEQLAGQHSGVSSDIYAFGATLCHLFTGQSPRSLEFLAQVAAAVKAPSQENRDGKETLRCVLETAAREPPPAPKSLRPEIPEALDQLLVRMLAVDPAQRPATMGEVAAELEATAKMVPATPWTGVGDLPSPSAETHVEAANLTQVLQHSTPKGFFDTAAFPRTQFFSDDQDRYAKIQETLKFYRDHLSREYASLWRQANLTYYLWIGCVGFGFAVLLAGIVTMLAGYTQQGAVTTLSTTLIYFIQRVFHQREDHYRNLAASKNAHLEYGNQWLLIIQSIDSMQDPIERAKRQAKLVDALTKKLTVIEARRR